MNITFEGNDFSNLNDSLLSFKIIYGINFCIIELITIICYSGIIHFEHYGGDPLKRDIKNKLTAEMCLIALSLSFFRYLLQSYKKFLNSSSGTTDIC